MLVARHSLVKGVVLFNLTMWPALVPRPDLLTVVLIPLARTTVTILKMLESPVYPLSPLCLLVIIFKNTEYAIQNDAVYPFYFSLQ